MATPATGPDITQRTFDFAVRVVQLCRHLDSSPGTSRALSRQLLRAGTSIGANVEEAQAGQSRPDFLSKLAIALQEARETSYWLRLLVGSKVIPPTRVADLQREAEELKKVLAAIIVSTKKRA